jgi:uncharacterized protein YprB with RNaseH-like and TPR domain
MKALFYDIESTDLARSFGHMVCTSFCGLDGEAYTYRGDKKPWKGKKPTDDSKLAVAVRDELETADIIISWNGILFDIPFINSALALVGERPVQVGERYGSRHLDLMYYAGGQSLRGGSRKLDNVAKFFSCNNQKTALSGPQWQDAAAGDKEAINYIVEHCEADVRVLRDVFWHLAPHVKKFQLPFSDWYQFLDKIPTRKHSK